MAALSPGLSPVVQRHHGATVIAVMSQARGAAEDGEDYQAPVKPTHCDFTEPAAASLLSSWRTPETFWPLLSGGQAQHGRNRNHSDHSRGRVRIHVPGCVCRRSRGGLAANRFPRRGGSRSEGRGRGVVQTRLILELAILRPRQTSAPAQQTFPKTGPGSRAVVSRSPLFAGLRRGLSRAFAVHDARAQRLHSAARLEPFKAPKRAGVNARAGIPAGVFRRGVFGGMLGSHVIRGKGSA